MSEQTQAVTTRSIPGDLAQTLSNDMPRIAELLPPDISVDQFRAALFLQLSDMPKVANATPMSVGKAVVKMAINGFLPGRDAALVVFKNEAQMIAEYRGLIRALYRTGRVTKAYAQVVRDQDQFEIDYGTDTLSHKPCLKGNAGAVYGAYALVVTKDGARHFHYMSLDELEKVRKSALGRDQEAWTKWTEEMYRKTVMKNLCKYLQLTPGVTTLIEEEDARQEEPAIIVENGKQAAIDLFGGYHEEKTGAVPDDTGPPFDDLGASEGALLDIWEAALCGAVQTSAPAIKRRRLLLSFVTGIKPEHINGPGDLQRFTKWQEYLPLFDYLVKQIEGGLLSNITSDKGQEQALLQQRSVWMTRQAPQSEATP